ncbi:MAG: hypothetical protein LBO66_14805 [Deltaproteobacteria bacterium]|jgi:molecular chaperone GrpE (heat shock protein)|nr:hypothetical protein [Deltaproteobacteria bacterium]
MTIPPDIPANSPREPESANLSDCAPKAPAPLAKPLVNASPPPELAPREPAESTGPPAESERPAEADATREPAESTRPPAESERPAEADATREPAGPTGPPTESERPAEADATRRAKSSQELFQASKGPETAAEPAAPDSFESALPDAAWGDPEPSAPEKPLATKEFDIKEIDEKIAQLSDSLKDAFKENSDALEKKLLGALESLALKLSVEGKKQEKIDALHAKLIDLEERILSQPLKPMLNGLIKLHDDYGKIQALYENEKEKITAELFLRTIVELQEDIEMLLATQDVRVYRESAKLFDPKRQTIVKIIASQDEADSGTISRSVRPGFENDSGVFAKERVEVFEYKPPLPGEIAALAKPKTESGPSTPPAPPAPSVDSLNGENI